MAMSGGLIHGPLGPNAAHVCVDMQRLFAEQTEWHTPWLLRVLPNVLALVEAAPERTIFTRFVPAGRTGEGSGTWRRYYERWETMTIERLGAPMVDLVPALQVFCPPALTWDKRVYSPWVEGDFHGFLRTRGVDTLVVSGGETDVCVLGTVLGGVDRGYRVIVASDALCSSSDETHDASLGLYHRRYGQQVETAGTAEIVSAWRRD